MAFRPNRREGGDDNRKGRREGGFNSENRSTGRPYGGGGEDRKPYGKSPEGGDRPERPRRDEGGDRSYFNNRDRGGERGSFNRDRDSNERPYRRDDNNSGEGGNRRDDRDSRGPFNRDNDRGGRPGFRRDDNRGEKPSFRRDGERPGFRSNERSEERGGYRSNDRSGDDRSGYRRGGGPDDRGGSRFENRDGGNRYNDRRESGRDFEGRGGSDRYRGGSGEDRNGERSENRRDDRSGGAGGRFDRRPDDHGGRDYSNDRRRNNESYGERRSRYDDRAPRREAPRRRDDDDSGRGGQNKRAAQQAGSNELMTLNKYLAHCGVSSRREAADIVKEGKVSVNGEVLNTPGYRVKPGDVVTLDGKTLTPERHHVYILLNKPKDFLTTTEDDRGRRTVLDLVQDADAGRLYPVGRLDRDTTGVLLLTNDGDFAQRLSHPKYEVKKVYQVTLDREVSKKDFDAIITGVELEDGVAVVDELAYLENRNEIGLQIHSGRNRIVRRIFEQLGYTVEKLDRVMYAGLTKKNVSRGKWRLLTEREVVLLKHFKNQ